MPPQAEHHVLMRNAYCGLADNPAKSKQRSI
jgi:hypothetical protein